MLNLMCSKLDSLTKKQTTEMATPVVSAPILMAQTGMDKKLRAKVQAKRIAYSTDCVVTIFCGKPRKKEVPVKLGFA